MRSRNRVARKVVSTASTPPVPPSSVLNLTNWDLALPEGPIGLFNNFYTGTCGVQVLNPAPDTTDSTCTTISAPGLVGYPNTSWIFTSGSAVAFKAPCWGSTTSTNTKSPRCELRSRVTGTGSTKSGDFIGNNLPKLRIRGGVQRVPDSGSHRTHIMQFHADTTAAPPADFAVSSSDVFMILSFDGDDGSLVSTVSTAPDVDGNQTNSSHTLVTGLPLSASPTDEVYDITAELQMGSNQIAWTVINLKTSTTTNYNQAIDSAWALVNMYAKAGAYSSSQALCSSNATTAVANGYLLAQNLVTDYFQTSLTVLTLTLLNP